VKQRSLFGEAAAASPRGPFAITAHIDGGSRGNPGPAAYGVVIRNARGELVNKLGEYLGIQTNNVAEYSGLLAALVYAQRERITSVRILSDSELLVKQMRGQYKVRSLELRGLYDRARALVRNFERFSIEHVMRESNKDADRVVNEVLDKQERGRHR
jgi:ribonuclease HI